MNLQSQLREWDDTVGEKVASLAITASRGFQGTADTYENLLRAISAEITHRPTATSHPISGFDPPER